MVSVIVFAFCKFKNRKYFMHKRKKRFMLTKREREKNAITEFKIEFGTN